MSREMRIDGMDEISAMLNLCGEKAQEVAARALYEGAGKVADAIRSEIGKIKTGAATYQEAYRKVGERLPSVEEKNILVEACGPGIGKFQKNGSEVGTTVGVKTDGYATLSNGRRVPVAVVARSINSGTSFMRRQPFVQNALRSVKKSVEAQIAADIEREMQQIIDNGG